MTKHDFEHNQHERSVHKTEHRIEHDLKHHPNDLHHVFHELEHLRRHESQTQFHQDLHEINDHLHKKGLLPKLEIVETDRRGLALVADSENPKHGAVISKNSHPRESEIEKRTYKHMHYDGWHDSATGDGGSDGHVNDRATNAEVPQGQRKALIDQALKLAGVPVSTANEAAVNLIIEHESSWNPNAINRTDSNARAGHPSQGLMQTIPSTFQKYALAGYNSNIDDPLSNVIAGIRYANARYGSLENVPGVRNVNEGLRYVGY